MNHTTDTISTLGGFPPATRPTPTATLAVAPNGDADVVVHGSEILRRDHTTGHVTVIAGRAPAPATANPTHTRPRTRAAGCC